MEDKFEYRIVNFNGEPQMAYARVGLDERMLAAAKAERYDRTKLPNSWIAAEQDGSTYQRMRESVPLPTNRHFKPDPPLDPHYDRTKLPDPWRSANPTIAAVPQMRELTEHLGNEVVRTQLPDPWAAANPKEVL